MHGHTSRFSSYCFSSCGRTVGWDSASSSWVNQWKLYSWRIYYFFHFGRCSYFHSLSRIHAEGEHANAHISANYEQPLGILPHQIRGSLPQFSQISLVGHSSRSCTACSKTVRIASPIFVYPTSSSTLFHFSSLWWLPFLCLT